MSAAYQTRRLPSLLLRPLLAFQLQKSMYQLISSLCEEVCCSWLVRDEPRPSRYRSRRVNSRRNGRVGHLWMETFSVFLCASLCVSFLCACFLGFQKRGRRSLRGRERERNVLTSSSFSSEFLSMRRWCWDCVFTRHRLALYGVSFYRTREMMLGVDAWEDRMFAGIRWNMEEI